MKTAGNQNLLVTLRRGDVLKALNNAVEDIIEAAKLDDNDPTVNALCLMLNATHDYLFRPGVTRLEDVIETSYDEDYDTVIGWITG